MDNISVDSFVLYYCSEDVLIEDKVQHLPSFLDAISCIVEELDEVSVCFMVVHSNMHASSTA